jgi:nitrogen regulatory protein P-II 1
MKKIEAIIRKSKFREVKNALVKAGVDNFSYWLVRNVGEATEARVYRGVEYEASAVERIHLSFCVSNKQSESVKLIIDNGITGEEGDGRIFISEISEAYKLITKDDSDEAIPLTD